MVVARAHEQVAGDVELLARAEERLVRVRELALDLVREERIVVEVEGPVANSPHRAARRADGSARMDQVVAEVGDAAPNAQARPPVDVVLELVDLGVDRVDDLEVGLRDVVDHPEHQLPHADVLGGLEAAVVPGLALRRRLAHDDEPVRRGDEVDLLALDPVLLGNRGHRDEDGEHVVAVSLEPRTLSLAGLRRQHVDDSVVDALRKGLHDLVLRRIEELEPALSHEHRA